ncbi:tetratricopeptide repeat protein [Leptospira bandrabouensis]|uniref:tetratricopeptide repeat protein n=1 Tax=Leptospira bandrabouensis TaxID=2484903 RepID=UPI001EE92E8F|nr:tetratricopeptide repeat protein [Leptospira bandrabouensis]MCG6146502.1 tetratricopeptide repeat protein [Leptospira bandrabouensis]MCG6161874.1 tetratricopeptide repeat protein [Leptospira bandrabouensis]MCG6166075.1 tetratricopeptide repeat protein [Leptospira bandrabouensis]
MELIHRLDDFFYSIFPNINKGNEKSIIQVLSDFYRVGVYEPEIIVSNGFVTVKINIESIETLEKDYKKIVTLCEKGKFEEAEKLLSPLVEVYPTNSDFHRLLGQIYSEQGKQELAIDSLINALRWNPNNAYALIMMGNIYLRFKDDPNIAMKYFNQALILNPGDYLTANNISATLLQLNRFDEAEFYLKKALESNSEFPNTHYGLGVVREKNGDRYGAFNSFYNSVKFNPKNDDRKKQCIHKLFEIAEQIILSEDIDDLIQKYKKELESKQPLPIHIEASTSIPYNAKIEYGELYNREFHLIKFQPSKQTVAHLVLHELVHLEFAIDARTNGKYKLITSDIENQNAFKIQIHGFLTELEKKNKSIDTNVYLRKLHDGLVSQIFNAPIDLFIERYLFERFEKLRPFQLFSLYSMMKEYIEASTSKKVQEFAPQFVISKNRILNLVSAMQFRELFHIDYVNDFNSNASELKTAIDFYDEFTNLNKQKPEGEEYEIIEKWAKRLQIDYLFNLVDEEYHIDPISTENKVSNEDVEMAQFLQSQEIIGTNHAVILHMIGARKYFYTLSKEEIKNIAIEIATIGTNGISPDKSGYTVTKIPGKSFSGYELLSYYYVSFAIALPELLPKLGLPFKDEFVIASKFPI